MANKAFKPRSHLKCTEVDDGRVLVYQMQRVRVHARVLAGVLALALPRQLLYGDDDGFVFGTRVGSLGPMACYARSDPAI
eukprot:251613-Rhodomonas_salina.1